MTGLQGQTNTGAKLRKITQNGNEGWQAWYLSPTGARKMVTVTSMTDDRKHFHINHNGENLTVAAAQIEELSDEYLRVGQDAIDSGGRSRTEQWITDRVKAFMMEIGAENCKLLGKTGTGVLSDQVSVPEFTEKLQGLLSCTMAHGARVYLDASVTHQRNKIKTG